MRCFHIKSNWVKFMRLVLPWYGSIIDWTVTRSHGPCNNNMHDNIDKFHVFACIYMRIARCNCGCLRLFARTDIICQMFVEPVWSVIFTGVGDISKNIWQIRSVRDFSTPLPLGSCNSVLATILTRVYVCLCACMQHFVKLLFLWMNQLAITNCQIVQPTGNFYQPAIQSTDYIQTLEFIAVHLNDNYLLPEFW